MTKRLHSFKTEERTTLESEIDAGKTTIDDKMGSVKNVEKIKSQYGTCCDCANFECVEFELIGSLARCSYFGVMLCNKDRIINCTAYSQRGHLSMYDMQQMAYIIDTSKREVGFKIK